MVFYGDNVLGLLVVTADWETFGGVTSIETFSEGRIGLCRLRCAITQRQRRRGLFLNALLL